MPVEHDVAGLERDQPAQVGELVGDPEQQVARVRLLHDLAVEVRAQREVLGVELGRRTSSGPSGRKPSWPLTRSIDAAVGVAEVVEADVVGARVAGHVLEQRVVDPDAVHALADNDGQLALVVEEPRAAGRRTTPRWPLSVVGGFMKYDGAAGRRAAYSSTGSRR